MKKATLIATLASFFALTACGPNLNDAKNLGFETVEQMKKLQADGYKTMDEFYVARAKKLGFESVEQMKTLQARGFETQQNYIDFQDSVRLGFPNVKLYLESKSHGYNDYTEYKSSMFQIEIHKTLYLFKQQWNEANTRKNEFSVKSIEDKFTFFKNELLNNPLQSKKWSCAVNRILSSKRIWCTYGIIEYDLVLEIPDPNLIQKLSAGDQIMFTGNVANETSWTISGAIRNPEFVVNNVEIHFKKP